MPGLNVSAIVAIALVPFLFWPAGRAGSSPASDRIGAKGPAVGVFGDTKIRLRRSFERPARCPD